MVALGWCGLIEALVNPPPLKGVGDRVRGFAIEVFIGMLIRNASNDIWARGRGAISFSVTCDVYHLVQQIVEPVGS